MITTFHLPADQLDLSVLKAIKEAFKGKDIEIIVSEASAKRSGAELSRRLENLRENKNTIHFSEEDFFKTYSKKIADAANKI